MEQKTPVVVVGAGPGGYAAAFMAADLGLEVALVDVEPNPGGVCLYRGCIPSKALLHAAKVLTDSAEAEELGIHFGEPRVDLPRLRAWKDGVVSKLTGGLGQLAKQRKVRYIRGRARFEDPRTLTIESAGGGDGAAGVETLRFEHAILATGSSVAWPSFLPARSDRILDSTGGLALKRVPKTLLVVGGSYIGLEMGTIYAALGAEVTVVEMLPGLVPGADRDLAAVLSRRVEKTFKSVLLGTKVVSMEERPDGVRVVLSTPAAEGDGDATSEHVFDAVLVSVGRKPNSGGLGLERTKAVVDGRGFLGVDLQRRTAEPSIFAIGDVAGDPMLAHKATHEGLAAAEAISGRTQAAFEPRAIPAVIFTDPEVAWCGLTQAEAEKQGRAVEVTRFPWAASGRALTFNRTDGMTKLVLEPGTGLVLGVGIVGPGAGELIGEGVLAVGMGARAEDLHRCIHPHPTLSETLMESAASFFGQCTHAYRPKRREAR